MKIPSRIEIETTSVSLACTADTLVRIFLEPLLTI